MPRVGLDELKAILVDDRDRLVAGLEERMQASIDAYRDPWQDGKVICPLHNYLFSFSDRICLNGDMAVRTYPVREEAGQIVVEA